MGQFAELSDLEILEEDFATLVRLSIQESFEDVRLLLAKLVRKYRKQRPEFAERINQSLRTKQARSKGSAALRRGPTQENSELRLPVDAESQLSLIRTFDDRAGLEIPLLPSDLLLRIQGIVRERKERSKLEAHGIQPSRSAIFVGPPGVGKTLSARWIASQLQKPLWVLDLTTVMSSLLGRTATNLRAVFDYARDNEAVLLLDEIDAIAKRRSDESDVGELKRLVTSMLQEVDDWPDHGLLLAATNHEELVDPAFWRRFDAVLEFSKPCDPVVLETAVRRFLGRDSKAFESSVPLLSASLNGSSLSDVERTVLSLRRTTVLDDAEPLQVVLKMAEPYLEQLEKPALRELAIQLAQSTTLSHNKIMNLTGVSRDTIRKHAGPSQIKGRGTKNRG